MKKWFAIFKTGKHTDSTGNTKEWTEEDLDKIVESYDPQKHEAPIVIGHPKTNAPAFGWIERLKRVGDTLYAYPKQLANEFVEMVKQGLFKKRSISLYPDGTLRHVGFLGAQPPAVKGLPDVEFKDSNMSISLESDEHKDLEEPEQPDVKELEEKIKNYEEQIKNMLNKEREFENLQNKYAEILSEKERLEKEVEKQKHAAQVKEFEEIVDNAIEQGRLLPKLRDNVIKIFEVISSVPIYEFSEGVKTQPVSLIKEFIESLPKMIDLGDTGQNKELFKRDEPVSKIVADEIRKQMGGNN